MLHTTAEKRFVEAVGLISLSCLVLFVARILVTDTLRYWFIPENLFLAWISLAAAFWLRSNLSRQRWMSWQNIALSIIWLIFLPNTWYVLTDYIHVYPNGEVSEIFDIGLISLLVSAGFALGFSSLFLVHRELLKRYSARLSHSLAATVLLLSSFAIYMGRQLRWNTWDIIANPGGVALNISDRLLNPSQYPAAFNTTVVLFVVLGSLYLALWRIIPNARPLEDRK